MTLWEFIDRHPILTVVLAYLAVMAVVGVAGAVSRAVRARAITINLAGAGTVETGPEATGRGEERPS